MSVKQVEAVINAVTVVLGGDFQPGATVVADVITPDQKEEVREIVLKGVLEGEVAFKGDLTDEAAVRRYVNGMVDNHLRKSRQLNGGSTYKASSTGARRDPQLKELNKLLKTLSPGSEDYAKVNQHIASRLAEIKQAKQEGQAASIRASIDTSVLPSHLAEMLNNQ